VRIREAAPGDEDSIREVHVRAIRELGAQAYSREQVEAWAVGCASADYAETITDEDTAFVVAVEDGQVVGFGTTSFSPPEEYRPSVDAEVTGVYVDPSVARRGVGSRIHQDLERRARERGAEVLGLRASLNAVPFYQTHGSHRVAERSHEFSNHESTDVTGTVVEMRREM
jgi:putative acetyltransferase